MFDFLKQAQQQSEDVKKRLENVFVEAESEGGMVKVTANGNKKITQISISPALVEEKDKEAIEELVLIAVNRAMEKAEKVFESEMQSVAMGILPNLKGFM